MIEVRCTGTSDEKGIILSCEGLESLTSVQASGLLDMIRDAVAFIAHNGSPEPEDDELETHAENARTFTEELYQECNYDALPEPDESVFSNEACASASLMLFYARKRALKDDADRSGGHDDTSC